MYRIQIRKRREVLFDKGFTTLFGVNLGDYGFPQFELIPNTALQEILSEKIWSSDPECVKDETLDLSIISKQPEDISLFDYDRDKVLMHNIVDALETSSCYLCESNGLWVEIANEDRVGGANR